MEELSVIFFTFQGAAGDTGAPGLPGFDGEMVTEIYESCN